MKVVNANPEVYEKLQDAVSNSLSTGEKEGNVQISQLLVTHPNYKYSIGSLVLSFLIHDGFLSVKLRSNYHFRRDVDRITKHVHNRMIAFKTRGLARDFDIEGGEWCLSMHEFSSYSISEGIRNKIDFNRLYL